MKKSKIKNQIFLIFNLTLLFVFPFSAFAHESEMPHEETIPTISPLLLVGLVAVLAIGGFLLWKFVLNPKPSSPTQSDQPEKTPSAQEETVSQSNQGDNPQKNG